MNSILLISVIVILFCILWTLVGFVKEYTKLKNLEMSDKADWKKRWIIIIEWEKILCTLLHQKLFIWDEIRQNIAEEVFQDYEIWRIQEENWKFIWTWEKIWHK